MKLFEVKVFGDRVFSKANAPTVRVTLSRERDSSGNYFARRAEQAEISDSCTAVLQLNASINIVDDSI